MRPGSTRRVELREGVPGSTRRVELRKTSRPLGYFVSRQSQRSESGRIAPPCLPLCRRRRRRTGSRSFVNLSAAAICWLASGQLPCRLSRSFAAVLQEDADRLALGLADQARVDVAAADVGEAADVAESTLRELVGPLPGDGEGADAARADAADGPAGRVVAQLVRSSPTSGRISFSQEPRVLVGRACRTRSCGWTGPCPLPLVPGTIARVDEDADRHRHFLLVDQVVEDDRHAELPLLVRRSRRRPERPSRRPASLPSYCAGT